MQLYTAGYIATNELYIHTHVYNIYGVDISGETILERYMKLETDSIGVACTDTN